MPLKKYVFFGKWGGCHKILIYMYTFDDFILILLTIDYFVSYELLIHCRFCMALVLLHGARLTV